MNLGERICTLRTERKMSQGDLANALDVSRQSISKWETNSSVPELDKLVKMGKLFGVTLDELILDNKTSEKSASQKVAVAYTDRSCVNSAQKTVGIVLLCFCALLWLIIALSGDSISGLILAVPFIFCGLICLTVRKNASLWCAWVIYLFIELYLRFATGINWQYIFLPYLYVNGFSVQIITAWCLWIIFAVLTVLTALFTQKASPGSPRSDFIGAISGWSLYVITQFVFVLPIIKAQMAVGYSQTYSNALALIGWIRNIILVVAVVFTLRLIAPLWKSLKNRISNHNDMR